MEEELVKSFSTFCLKDFAEENRFRWTCHIDDDIEDCYDRILTKAVTRYTRRNAVTLQSVYTHLHPLIKTVSQFEYRVVDIAGSMFETGYSANTFIYFTAWTSYIALRLNEDLKLGCPEAAILLLEDTVNYFIDRGEFYGKGGGWNGLYEAARKQCKGMLQEMVFYNKNRDSNNGILSSLLK